MVVARLHRAITERGVTDTMAILLRGRGVPTA